MEHSLVKPRFSVRFQNDYLKIFCLSLLVAALIFLPFLILDNGYFLYFGDFNVQQIPFYQLSHQAIRDGNIFWNWNTDLGANFIGSYSFYLLGSPFFWLTLIFPNAAVPFLMAPLLILKFACAGLAGFAFIKRFTKSNQFAMIGALLYAFCGFNVFNIFFNHFHEPVIIFPLMLVALEEFVINGRRGCFALTVFAAALINYFFFAGQAVFLILYFIVRCFSKDFNINIKKFLLLGLETIIGIMLACCILLPAVMALMGNPRTDNFPTGMNILLYDNTQRYGLILESLFFPPDIPSRPNFFPDSNAKWSSVSAFLPLFSLSGVLVFVKNFKNHWLKRILLICGIMALIPVLNSAFYAFNSSYYARWFYMPILMMCLATCLALEDVKLDFKWGIKACLIAVLSFSVIGIIPTKKDDIVTWFSLPPYPERFWGYVAIALLSILILILLIQLPRHSKKFIRYTTLATCFIIVAYSLMVIGTGKSHSNSYYQIVEQGMHGSDKFTLDESEFYRIDTHEAMDNLPMFWNIPTIRTFHSIVPVSIMKFYDSMGYDRNVASRPELKYYGVRGLTSTKYILCEINEKDQPTVPGFEKISIQNGFNIYENQYFIPMGFTYDYYVDPESFEKYVQDDRDKLMLRAMSLSAEDAEKYADVLEQLPSTEFPNLSEQGYINDCLSRQETAGYEFSYDNSGFTSKIKMERENLVFYSVPYDDGWTATVNGEPAEIVQANQGFMAVLAPAGDNEIVFKYYTTGLNAGIAISLAGLFLLLVYLLIVWILRKKHPMRYQVKSRLHRNLLLDTDHRKAENAYIRSVINQSDHLLQASEEPPPDNPAP